MTLMPVRAACRQEECCPVLGDMSTGGVTVTKAQHHREPTHGPDESPRGFEWDLDRPAT
jgi:hypothetical protein